MTRGVYHSMYRGRLWTMRQFAGFGTAEETNERYQFLLAQGQGGLSVAFDMPTLMGRDSDDPRSEGEVGRCGVATDSLADFEALFGGIDLGGISTSMTISGPATILFAFYLAAAERQGVAWSALDGTLQTDILKEYIAQKEWLFPPRPHLRLIGDLIEFCASEAPKFHPISVSGYHIREAGSTAAQELAFTLADGFAYVELGQQRGLDVDTFSRACRSSSNAHIDSSRRSPVPRGAANLGAVAARRLRRGAGASLGCGSTTDGRVLADGAAPRTTSCGPPSRPPRPRADPVAAHERLDEVSAADRRRPRSRPHQQVIAHETGVANVIDPLGGSYFVEALTNHMEEAAEAYFDTIREMGRGSMLGSSP
jgi:methylmalonyl-CoA mutase N-terminal domain/subunit